MVKVTVSETGDGAEVDPEDLRQLAAMGLPSAISSEGRGASPHPRS